MQSDHNQNRSYPAPRASAGTPSMPSREMALLLGVYSNARSPRDHLTAIFKHKYGVLVAMVLVSCLALAASFGYMKLIYVPEFEARSLVLVKFGWENNNPDLSLEARRTPMASQSEIVTSEVRILQSRELKERVIGTLKVERIFPELLKTPLPGLTPNEAAFLRLDKYLSVTPAAKGNIIEVSMKANNPGTAASIVNSLVGFYIDKRTEVYRDPKSIMFLDKKTEEYRQKLADSENKLKAFKDQYHIVSFEEQRTALLNQRMALLASLDSTANQQVEVQERVAFLEKSLQTIPKTAPNLSSVDRKGDAESRLLALQLHEKELRSKYKEDNPLVVNVRNQIQMVEEYLDKQGRRDSGNRTSPADPVYQDVFKQVLQGKAELNSAKVRKTSLEQQLTALNTEIQGLEAQEGKNRELQREFTNNEEKFKSYRQRLEEARIYDELERQKMTSVSVIEPAAPPLVPVNPLKPLALFVIGSILAGICGGLVLAFGLEFLKRGITTPAEAERRVGIPVLVAVQYKN